MVQQQHEHGPRELGQMAELPELGIPLAASRGKDTTSGPSGNRPPNLLRSEGQPIPNVLRPAPLEVPIRYTPIL